MEAELRVAEAVGMLEPVLAPEAFPGHADAGKLREHVGKEGDSAGHAGVDVALGRGQSQDSL